MDKGESVSVAMAIYYHVSILHHLFLCGFNLECIEYEVAIGDHDKRAKSIICNMSSCVYTNLAKYVKLCSLVDQFVQDGCLHSSPELSPLLSYGYSADCSTRYMFQMNIYLCSSEPKRYNKVDKL